MTKQQRNYRLEYKRRIARGLSKGWNRAASRGHGSKPGGASKSRAKFSSDQRYLEKGVKLIKLGSSLAAAARNLHVAPERLRNYLVRSGIARKRGSRWRIGPDDRIRQMLVFSEGRELRVRVEREAASSIGGYMNDVGRFLESNNTAFLSSWADRYFTGVNGRKHRFETNPNTLYRLNSAGRNSFDEIYKIIT